jgi:transposase
VRTEKAGKGGERTFEHVLKNVFGTHQFRKMEMTRQERRVQVLTLKNQGVSNQDIAVTTGLSVRGIQKIFKTVKQTNSFKDRPRKGRPQKLTDRNKRAITRMLKKKEATTATALSKALKRSQEIQVSRFTVARALKSLGYACRIKKKKPKLTEKHKKARLAFAKKYESWTADDWKNVIWSDESKFNLLNSDGKEYFWTDRPEELTEEGINPTLKFGGGGIMVWSCLTWHGVNLNDFSSVFSHFSGVGYSCKIDDIMDADLYVRILKSELMDSIEYYDLDRKEIIFQQDNDPKHTSKLAKGALEDLNLKVLQWPSQSPDLNPIEHFWGHVARELKRRTGLLPSKDELWNELQTILAEPNKDLCRKLIGTMPRRIIDVIKAKGGYTKW